jgi:pimeloyl-ACP methyl ester carboxylesterase
MAADLYVAESGAAQQPVVVLLHCMGRTGTMWDRHRALLAKRFRVLAPDLPGHGRSAGPFTVRGAVAALADMFSRTCGDEPVHLVGLSLGARVGLKLAAERELASVASLALLGCGLRYSGGPQLAITRAMPSVFFRGRPDRPGKAALVASMKELAALDLRPALPAVSARTLVACGDKDKPYLADSREIAATMSAAELRLIPDAGHLWPLQRVNDFVALVSDWVDRG